MTPTYLLLTACRNEAQFLPHCIEAVIRQKHRPVRWIISDDSSTDGTLAIAQQMAAETDFIEVRQVHREGGRSFGAQYRAQESAYASARKIEAKYVGFLDADTAVQGEDYFARMLTEFEQDPQLGVAGSYLLEPDHTGRMRPAPGNAPWTVAGGVQTFRRSVYDQIGGYVPLELGGSDVLAEIRARMLGYRSVSFPHLLAQHFRPPSTAEGWVPGMIKGGRMDASFGYHPVYAILKFLRRLSYPPMIRGSVVRFSAYCWEAITRGAHAVPPEVAAFVRTEQMERLVELWQRRVSGNAAMVREPAR